MVHLIVNWLLSALALWLVALIIPGITLRGFGAAMLATIAIAIVNATIGVLLKIVMFPLILVTLGLFTLVLNAVLLKLASLVVPGFAIRGFWAAFLGSIVLTIIGAVLRFMVFPF